MIVFKLPGVGAAGTKVKENGICSAEFIHCWESQFGGAMFGNWIYWSVEFDDGVPNQFQMLFAPASRTMILYWMFARKDKAPEARVTVAVKSSTFAFASPETENEPCVKKLWFPPLITTSKGCEAGPEVGLMILPAIVILSMK